MVSQPTFNFRARTFQITQFINLSWLNHPTLIGLAVVPFRIDSVKIPFILGIYLLMYLENMIFYTFDGFFSKAHIIALHHLLNYKTAGIKIAIETTIGGGKLQNAVVRVGYTTGIVLLVAITPNHLFRGWVG